METGNRRDPMTPIVELQARRVCCSICGAERPLLVLEEDTTLSEAVAEAVANGRVIVPRQPLPDPRPTWVCQECGSWVYYDGVDSQSLYPI